MALHPEIQQALEMSSLDGSDYRIEEAFSGWLIYKNCVTAPGWKKEFFPYTSSRPFVSDPISTTIINRIVDGLYKKVSYRVTLGSLDITDAIMPYLDEMHWSALSREAFARTLATGGQLFWFSIPEGTKMPKVELVQPYFAGKIVRDGEATAFYQHYNYDERTGVAVLDRQTQSNAGYITKMADDTTVSMWKNGTLIYELPHNLPFTPAVWADNIDKDESSIYGVPFTNRFRDQLINLWAVCSQRQKALLFLQNVWIAKVDMVPAAGDEPLSLEPDNINYLDQNGSLEQALRNLDLTEEAKAIEEFKSSIYRAAQVPNDDALTAAGKVESGVALQILYRSYDELMSSLRTLWSDVEEEVLEKYIRLLYIATGKTDPADKLVVEVSYNDAVMPIDVDKQVARDLLLLQAGLITKESLVRKYNTSDMDIMELLDGIQSTEVLDGNVGTDQQTIEVSDAGSGEDS